jgi:spore germination protein KC
MRSTLACAAGMLLISMLLAGCWDRTELNELSITSATAVDREKDNWTVSFQVIIPSSISGTGGVGGSGSSLQAPVTVHSVTSRTIKEAAALSYLESPRKLYFGHNSVLVISEKTARAGITPVIDIYLRNHESRETVSVLVSSEEARTVLEQLISIDRIPGQGIQRLLEKEQRGLSYLSNVRLYELAMDLLGESKTGILPEIKISGAGEVTRLDKLKGTTQPSKLKLGRLAVIHEDKMIGWLSQTEALGTAFLKGRVKETTIPFSCSGNNPKKPDSTYLLANSKTKITPRPEGDAFAVQVEIKTKGRLNEADCSADLLKPDVIRQVEQQIEKEIERTTLSAWEAVSRLEADVAGLSAVLQRKYPDQWKQFKKGNQTDWKSIKLNVKADVKLERVGLSNKAFRKMLEE